MTIFSLYIDAYYSQWCWAKATADMFQRVSRISQLADCQPEGRIDRCFIGLAGCNLRFGPRRIGQENGPKGL